MVMAAAVIVSVVVPLVVATVSVPLATCTVPLGAVSRANAARSVVRSANVIRAGVTGPAG